jgi:hypothetical protein
MIGVYGHNVVVFGYGPVRPEHLVRGTVMHGRFPPQPLKVGPKRIVPKEFRLGDVQVLNRN